MTTEFVIKKFESVEVFFMEDGYINATKIAKQFGKRPETWLKTEPCQELMTELLITLHGVIEQNQLVIVKRGAPETGGGTWLHPKLAIHFAYWLSPKFAVWVGEQIEIIIRRINYYQQRPYFPVELHPILHFPVVGRREDTSMKQTRNTYTSVLDTLGFAAAVYKRCLTNNVSRILIGMTVKPFRRLHGIPAGSRRRTRLYYDSDLRRTMDEIEDIACQRLLQDFTTTSGSTLEIDFEEIEKIVYDIARTVYLYVQVRGVDLLEHLPQQELELF